MSLIDGQHSVPEGLGMRLALDMQAMSNFAKMSDDGKQQLIDYIKGSTSGDDAKSRVTEVVSNLHNGGSFS